jgi:hypothetical protein
MNARTPESTPRPTYTHWPAARPPDRVAASSRPQDRAAVLRQDAEQPTADLDEPGYGHGV